MKKKLVTALAGILTIAALLVGCSGANKAGDKNVTIEGYKGIEIEEIENAEVTDEEVDAYIKSILVQYSPQEVKTGDTVNIDYVGVMDGEQFDGGTSQGVDLEIGSNTFIPGFEDSVIGHTAGDTYDFNGKFPDDYAIENLKGRDVTFTITVNYIEGEPELPELTDELVQTLSDTAKTVEEYKKEVKEELQKGKDNDYKSQLQTSAWDAAMEKAEIKEYPEERVQNYMDLLMDQYKSYAEASNMELEDMLQSYYQMTLEDFEKQTRSAAEESIKQEMVAEAIAKKEKLTPTDEEYEKAFEQLAKDYGYDSVDALREVADDDTLKSIVLQNIVKEYLAENAVQKKK